MGKKIEDFLHLYLGCEVQALDGGTMMYIFSGIDRDGLPTFKTITNGFAMHLSKWKIILRPLSDMTEGEKEKMNEFAIKTSTIDSGERACEYIGESALYLLSKHFDLFNLIPEGLAIDKTLQTSKP